MQQSMQRFTSSTTVSLGTLLEQSYRNNANSLAVIDGNRQLTYRQLGERVHRAINAFLSLGTRPGEPIVLVSNNRAEFLEVDHASVVGRFIRVAEVPRLHPREIAQVINDCSARVVVVEESWLEKLLSIRAELSTVEHIIVFGEARDGILSYEELLRQASDAPPTAFPGPDDIGWLLYTSGTTGRPKGVTLSHANLVAMVRNILLEMPPLDGNDIIAHTAPLGHMSGAVGLCGLIRGATQLPLPKFDAHELLRVVEQYKVTVMIAVPTMLNLLTLAAEEGTYDVSSLRLIPYGASAIAPDRLFRAIRIFGEVFVQFYGQSEAPLPISSLSQRAHRANPDGSIPDRLSSAGRVNPAVEVRIVDPDHREVPFGDVGEVAIRSDMVMLGYWNQPEATAEAIDKEGWLYTGDVGRFDEEGYLHIVDRKKDMVVSGGFNIYPSEVEHVISTIRGVQEVAVVGIPNEQWGEAITAVVVLRPGYQLSAEEVISVCRNNLASYKSPKRVEFWEVLPKSERGKILRREIRAKYWNDRERKV